MTRREFAQAGAGALVAQQLGGATMKRATLELRTIFMRNTGDKELQRTSDFLRQGAGPALLRAGAGPIGVFASVIAPESPFLMVLTQYPTLADMETIRDKEAQDPAYVKVRDAYNAAPQIGFQRLESSLLRCFESMPSIEVPPALEKGSRVFELRMYESNNANTLARKIKMFNEGEIGIFKRLGMRPVFFAETLVGTRMPNLVYMLSFDNLAARESAWSAFGADAEWKELRSKPGNSDDEIVSNISNAILRPLPFSQIK